jgi:hypothetical protein
VLALAPAGWPANGFPAPHVREVESLTLLIGKV